MNAILAGGSSFIEDAWYPSDVLASALGRHHADVSNGLLASNVLAIRRGQVKFAFVGAVLSGTSVSWVLPKFCSPAAKAGAGPAEPSLYLAAIREYGRRSAWRRPKCLTGNILSDFNVLSSKRGHSSARASDQTR